MPIKLPENLPAFNILKNEGVSVLSDVQASRQDIRPLRIALLNLMPKKIQTERGNTSMMADWRMPSDQMVSDMFSSADTHLPQSIPPSSTSFLKQNLLCHSARFGPDFGADFWQGCSRRVSAQI